MPVIQPTSLLTAMTLAQEGAPGFPWLPSTAAAAAMVLGFSVIAWQLWQRRKKLPATPRQTRPAPRGSTELEAFNRDATQVVDRLAAVLDAKADRIERLIEEADRRILALERAAGSQARREEFTEGARRAIRPQPAPRPADESMAADPGLHERILHLSGRGLRPVEIAKQLHQPIGQVELVIALHRGALKL